MEETKKRTEASLARKRANPIITNGAGLESPASPVSSGAMDSLLEKLRAAAPQARDQRDRRRRARLKERHQIRVASGQQMPAISGIGDNEDGARSNESIATDTNGSLLSPKKSEEAISDGQEAQVSESEDVADRAANLLQGLRNNSDAGGERPRRRRESAEEERRARRMRRRTANGASKDGTDGSLPTVDEISSPTKDNSTRDSLNPPSIIVSPSFEPSHEEGIEGSSPDKPVEISD